jgi:hypothetical protein
MDRPSKPSMREDRNSNFGLRPQLCFYQSLRGASNQPLFRLDSVPELCYHLRSPSGYCGSSAYGLSPTTGYFDACLEISSLVHQTPFIFPSLCCGVVLNFPRLIESFEPEYIC